MKKLSKRAASRNLPIDPLKLYPLQEAVALAQKASFSKFDGSVELHVNLGLDPKKTEQRVSVTTTLPHATGKKITIAVMAEGEHAEAAEAAGADIVGGKDLLDKFESGWVGFDVLVATPDMMPILAKVAKILGPKGLMPSPKNNTVTTDVAKTIANLRAGQLSFKTTDKEAVIHVAIGKCSMDTEKLAENAMHILKTIKDAKPAKVKGAYLKSAFLSPTMGPSIRLSLE